MTPTNHCLLEVSSLSRTNIFFPCVCFPLFPLDCPSGHSSPEGGLFNTDCSPLRGVRLEGGDCAQSTHDGSPHAKHSPTA